MSNETDLDWLARNVHVWREGANYVCVNHTDGGHVFHEHNRNCAIWFTKDQWLARRAESQNKPSWASAPEWANWIAQSPICFGSGIWCFFSGEPTNKVNGIWSCSVGKSLTGRTGLILGHWRDTLEKRPEEFKPSIEEANKLSQEFKQFTSIEDNQDREGVSQKLTELEMLGKVSHLISDNRHRITPSKYTKAIRGVSVDVYDVLMAWGVTNPALQHLIKKALQCGQRGHKDNEHDLQDIIDSAIRAKELG